MLLPMNRDRNDKWRLCGHCEFSDDAISINLTFAIVSKVFK